MHWIGVDLGGTNIAAAVVAEDGAILGRGGLPCPRGVEAVADAMARAVRMAAEDWGGGLEHIDAVGVGSPGTIDPQRGMVELWSNLSFEHVPLAELLSQRLDGREVLLENDANVAALGEYAAGAGRGARSMVAITLGTGIGGGAVLDGKLYTGFNYAGMEVGHMSIAYDGPVCTCGRRGCFETLASATALVRQARSAMEEHRDSLLWRLAPTLEQVNGKVIFAALERGDAAARAVVDQYLNYLACGVVNLINVFQPEVLCIGGGISQAGDVILKPVQDILDREDYARNIPRRTRVTRAVLGNDAGLIGAAMLPGMRR